MKTYPMQTDTLLDQLGILYLDHIAVTTYDLEATTRNYLAMPEARLIRGPGINPTQKVNYCFVSVSGTTFEILAPMAKTDSPILSHLKSGGGPYHICYAVQNLYSSLEVLLKHGAKVLVEPVNDIAFDGRKVMFAYTMELGVFELVEAMPADYQNLVAKTTSIDTAVRSHIAPPISADSDIATRIKTVFTTIFPSMDDIKINTMSMENTSDWDSLSHLRLIMELEKAMKQKISSSDVYKLTSYQSILDYFENIHG